MRWETLEDYPSALRREGEGQTETSRREKISCTLKLGAIFRKKTMGGPTKSKSLMDCEKDAVNDKVPWAQGLWTSGIENKYGRKVRGRVGSWG